MILAWVIANSSWLIPSLGWGYSEYLGYKSGGDKASVSQVLLDFFKFASTQAAEKNDPPGPNNDKLG